MAELSLYRPQIKGEGNLLSKAESLLEALNLCRIRYIRDGVGKKAVLFKGFVLIARSYVLDDNVLSVDFDLLRGCVSGGKYLVVYVDSLDRFFVFDPRRVMNSGFKGRRGGETYWEFVLELGVDLFEYLESKGILGGIL